MNLLNKSKWVKNLACLTLLCLGMNHSTEAQISTFPYSYDFENEIQGTTSCNGTYTLQEAGWSNATADDVDWTSDRSGTSSSNTGPSNDHTPTGLGYYMYIEASSPCSNSEAHLLTPVFDFTSIAPRLRFWYHMYGSTMGDLFIDATTNGGTTWTQIGGPITDNANLWQEAVIDASAYAGQSSVQFRFRGLTGSSFYSDMAIDDVTVEALPNDNIGVTALVNPVIGGAGGLQNVDVTVSNLGGNAVSGFNVDWTIDGVAQTQFVYGGATLALGASTTVNLGTYNFPSGSTNLKFWTSVPNGVADNNPTDDTLSVLFCQGLAGTYTVGTPTSDFPNLAAAMSILTNCGMSAPVVLQMQAGVYTGQVLIDQPITGLNAVNTLTIDGGNVATFTHDGSGTNGQAVILIDEIDYITIQNCTITNTKTSSDAWGIMLTGGADHNKILNNTINMPVGTTFDVAGIVASSSLTSTTGTGVNANYTLVQGNTVTGGDKGISFYGGGTTNPNTGNQFVDNTVSLADDYGMYLYYQDSMLVDQNKVSDITNIFSDAIYCYYPSNFTISANQVSAEDIGIYVSAANTGNAANGTSYIVNNMILAKDQGLYVGSMEDVNIYHNTAKATNEALYISSITSGEVMNNIWVSEQDFVVYYGSFNFNPTNIDYNCYNRTDGSTDLISLGGTIFTDLATWQAANNFDAASVVGDPRFASATDLHVSAALVNNKGFNVGITVDIDGDTRPYPTSTQVDMGADEFILYAIDAGVVALTNPTQPASPGFQAVNVEVFNFGEDTINNVTIEWTYNGLAQSSYLYNATPIYPGSSQIVNLGSVNFVANSSNSFSFWTSMPNSVMDMQTSNDTLDVDFCFGLSGTFTLGTMTSDYPTFADAITALEECGVAGPVVFEVQAGVYEGGVVLENYPGVSAVNTVTFDGLSRATFVQNAANTLSSFIHLKGANHITLQNFVMDNTATAGTFTVYLSDAANNNKILNNEINLEYVSGISNVGGIVASASATSYTTEGNNANYNTVQGNTITGGDRGIHFEGSGIVNQENKGNKILDNTLSGMDDFAISGDEQDSIEISFNTISGLARAATDAIEFNDLRIFKINYNNIQGRDRGISVIGGFSGNSSDGEIINNMVTCNASQGEAIYLSYITISKIHHNTAQGNPAIYLNDFTNLDIQNNIFYANSDYAFEAVDNNSMSALNYNLYFRSLPGSLIRFGTTANTYASLATWQAAGFGYDVNSVQANPQFYSTTNLHVLGGAANDAGNPAINVPFDIDGESRPQGTAPDMGADEYVFATEDCAAAGVPALQVCADSSTAIEVLLVNSGINSIDTIPVQVNVTGAAAQTYTDTLFGSIASGATATFTVGTLNTAGGGTYNYEIITTLANDGNPVNDTINVTVVAIGSNVLTGINDTICVGTDAILSVQNTSTAAVSWYATATSTTALSQAYDYTLTGLTADTTLYVQVGSCLNTRIPVTATVENIPVLTLGADTVICGNQSVQLDASTNATSYLWNTGSTNPALVTADSGLYIVEISTSQCMVYDSIYVSSYNGINVSANVADINCGGNPTGSVDLTVTGGVGNLTYAWSNGATTQDLNTLAEGIYTLVITDSNLCSYDYAYQITEPTPLGISNVSFNSPCGTSTGSIDIDVFGGAGALTYAWSNGATTQDLTNLVGGNYSLTVTDTSNCTATTQVTLPVSTPISIVIDTVIAETQYNNGAIELTVTGGSGNVNILWGNGATTEDLLGIHAGTYTVTVVDANGCTATATITVPYKIADAVTTIEGLRALDVFPNPSSDVVNFNISLEKAKDIKITVFDAIGQEIQSLQADNTVMENLRLDVSELASGVYTARILIGGQSVTTKVIVE